jgi:hypothetical protein
MRYRVLTLLAVFAFAMALRGEVSSPVARVLLAGVAGGFGGLALSWAVAAGRARARGLARHD